MAATIQNVEAFAGNAYIVIEWSENPFLANGDHFNTDITVTSGTALTFLVGNGSNVLSETRFLYKLSVALVEGNSSTIQYTDNGNLLNGEDGSSLAFTVAAAREAPTDGGRRIGTGVYGSRAVSKLVASAGKTRTTWIGGSDSNWNFGERNGIEEGFVFSAEERGFGPYATQQHTSDHALGTDGASFLKNGQQYNGSAYPGSLESRIPSKIRTRPFSGALWYGPVFIDNNIGSTWNHNREVGIQGDIPWLDDDNAGVIRFTTKVLNWKTDIPTSEVPDDASVRFRVKQFNGQGTSGVAWTEFFDNKTSLVDDELRSFSIDFDTGALTLNSQGMGMTQGYNPPGGSNGAGEGPTLWYSTHAEALWRNKGIRLQGVWSRGGTPFSAWLTDLQAQRAEDDYEAYVMALEFHMELADSNDLLVLMPETSHDGQGAQATVLSTGPRPALVQSNDGIKDVRIGILNELAYIWSKTQQGQAGGKIRFMGIGKHRRFSSSTDLQNHVQDIRHAWREMTTGDIPGAEGWTEADIQYVDTDELESMDPFDTDASLFDQPPPDAHLSTTGYRLHAGSVLDASLSAAGVRTRIFDTRLPRMDRLTRF